MASDGAVGDGFGEEVAISGNTVVVGDYLIGSDNYQGSAYVFDLATTPTITSPPVKSATVGQKYAYQLKINASANQAITFCSAPRRPA